jgi:hypothetical protein
MSQPHDEFRARSDIKRAWSGFTSIENRNRSSIFALSHFRTENRIPLFLKML